MSHRHGTYREFDYTPKIAGLDDLGSSLITLTVNLTQYRANLRAILDFISPSKLICVLKANAYGFGVGGLVPILNEFQDAVSLGVATADEALELKALGYEGRIVLLGYTHPKNYYQIVHSGCQLSAYRPENIPELARACSELKHPLELHIKVDTGMTRLGVAVEELAAFIRQLRQYPQIAVVGLFSHLVDSGNLSAGVNREQEEQFTRAIEIATDELGYRPECHLANSGGTLNMPHLHLDSVRAGIITYGVCPPGEFNRDIGVRECFTLASEVIDIHRIPAGRGVSYTHSYKAEQPTTIITMPCGYADGMPRSLSNKVDILLGGRRYPQAGNITMDYVMADVGDAPVSIGDEVVFIGRQGAEEIRLSDIARQAGVLPYQVSCGWGPRVRRVYLEE